MLHNSGLVQRHNFPGKLRKPLKYERSLHYYPAQMVMYTTEYCSDCARAEKFFEANNIPHLRVRLEGNTEATDFVMKINNGYRSVPTIFFPDGSILVEPGWEELKAKFSDS